jgi:hypothetical protein
MVVGKQWNGNGVDGGGRELIYILFQRFTRGY